MLCDSQFLGNTEIGNACISNDSNTGDRPLLAIFDERTDAYLERLWIIQLTIR